MVRPAGAGLLVAVVEPARAPLPDGDPQRDSM
jgi:hypothetical protein